MIEAFDQLRAREGIGDDLGGWLPAQLLARHAIGVGHIDDDLGILLLALDRAFTARVRFLGVDWGWGAVLSCALFGMAHAFGFSDGHFSFDGMTMALTAWPSFIAVWLRLRTGSVLFPILLHNFGNSLSLLI